MNEVAMQTQTKAVGSVRSQSEQPLSSDLIIPYLLLAQATSELVKDRKAQIGDFVRSTNGDKFGDPETPVEVILLGPPRTFWRVDQQIAGTDKWKYLKTEPRGAHNEILDFKFWGDKDGNVIQQSPNAILHRRFKQFRLFAILPADIEAEKTERAKAERGEMPDVSKALTPVIISLQSLSGYPCGKEIQTFATKAASFNVPLWKFKVQFTCTPEKNDQGTFYAWKLTGTNPAKQVPKEDLAVVERWAQTVVAKADQLKVDESAENQIIDVGPAQPLNKEAVADVC